MILEKGEKMEISEKKKLSSENLISAIERAFYGGERFILRMGEVAVGLVPVEDMEAPELVEIGERSE